MNELKAQSLPNKGELILKNNVNTPCFICSSTKSTVLYELAFPALHYPGEFVIRECAICGLLFNSPRLTEESLYDLYDSDYYFFQRRDSDEFGRVSSIFLRTISLIEKDISEKRVVEVGSAKGYLLALMKQLGWIVQGIEISSSASNYAYTKFSVPTHTGTVDSYSNSNEKNTFPLVLAIDVLEHVPDPISFVQSINKIIQKNGILIIDTPNANSTNLKILKNKWEAFIPFHIYFFSESNLREILSRMGYSVELCFSYNNSKKHFNIKRDIYNLLFLLRIHSTALNIYRRFKYLLKGSEQNFESCISKSKEFISTHRTYFNTIDSKGLLASENKGDNVVIIARKL